jgi:hypothetical protein
MRWAGRVALVVEHLLNKHEFKPQYCQKKKKKGCRLKFQHLASQAI